MRSLLNNLEGICVWVAFFVTTVYGHVALKLATGTNEHYEYRKAFSAMGNFWGWSAMLAWAISAFLWAVVLTKHTALSANTVSAMRYVLICISAVLVLNEAISTKEVAGCLLVVAGVWLIAR